MDMTYNREILDRKGRVILSEAMIEIAPHCYVNYKMIELVLGSPNGKNEDAIKRQGKPIGNSLRPWRKWLDEGELSKEKNWTDRKGVDKRIRLQAKVVSLLSRIWRRI